MAQAGEWFADHLATITILLLPVYAGVTALLYRWHRRLYVEHLVFTLHVQSFTLLSVLPVLPLPGTVSGIHLPSILVSLTLHPVYTALAMRRFYGPQHWAKTVLKVMFWTGAQYFLAGVVGIVLLSVFMLLMRPR